LNSKKVSEKEGEQEDTVMEEGEILLQSRSQEPKTSREEVSLTSEIQREDAGIPLKSSNVSPICKV
jgi:hypothetical protein